MPRLALPIHENAMPALEMNRFVVPMLNVTTSVDVSVTRHAAPRECAHSRIG
jgi:hypothetical protein